LVWVPNPMGVVMERKHFIQLLTLIETELPHENGDVNSKVEEIKRNLADKVELVASDYNGELVAVEWGNCSTDWHLYELKEELNQRSSVPFHPCIIGLLACCTSGLAEAFPPNGPNKVPQVMTVREYYPFTLEDVLCRAQDIPLAGRLTLVRNVLTAVSLLDTMTPVLIDLRPATIAVTTQFEVKLGGLGLYQHCRHRATCNCTTYDNTYDLYYFSEARSWKLSSRLGLSTSSLVYTLGCLVLEILTGKRFLMSTQEPGFANMYTLYCDLYGKNRPEPEDQIHELFPLEVLQVKEILLSCFAKNPRNRPSWEKLRREFDPILAKFCGNAVVFEWQPAKEKLETKQNIAQLKYI